MQEELHLSSGAYQWLLTIFLHELYRIPGTSVGRSSISICFDFSGSSLLFLIIFAFPPPFVTFFLSDLDPSSLANAQFLVLMYKLVPPHIWVSLCILVWGIASMLQATAQSWSAMMAARFFLGVAEAGYGTGLALYLRYVFLPCSLRFLHA